MKLTILSGTNRSGSNTHKVAVNLAEIYRELGQPTDILSLTELPPEIFAATSYAEKPASFAPLVDRILASDGVHIVTPEYNGGFPGVLKYFIDMLPFPAAFEHRPVAFTGVSAGIWGALRPIEQLQAILTYRNAYLFPERVFMPGINGHLSPEGKLTHAEWHKRLHTQAAGFIGYVKRIKQID